VLVIFEPPLVQQGPNTWIKRSPLKESPVSPGLGYECSLVYDPVAARVIRWAGIIRGVGVNRTRDVVLDR